MYVKLGNEAAAHRPHGDSVMASAGGDVAPYEKLDGPRVLYINPPDDATLVDIFQDITKPAGIWHAHTAIERDENGNITCPPPTWVDTDVPGLAELLKAQYGCEIGEPADVEETHHTESGPPGVGPADVGSADVPAEKPKRSRRTSTGRGFGTIFLGLMFVAWFYMTRLALRVDAGKDFQSKVMGDTASTGTGSYASATYIALTENTSAPAAGDTALTGELTGGGLARAQATYAHTAGAASYTETKTFTSSDATNRTIHKAGLFNASATGTLVFESALAADAILASGDTLTITWTISI